MDIISAILEIDKKANDMLAQGEAKREEIIAEADSTERSMKNDINSAADEKISAFEKEQEQAYAADKKELDEKSQQAQKELISVFEENCGAWEKKIADSIIG